MKIIELLLLSIALAFGGGDPGAEVPERTVPEAVEMDNRQKGEILRVVDGDTYEIFINKKEKVRLIGVDTPESVAPQKERNVKEGKTASDFAKELLEGRVVEIEYDVQERDRYGRVLAYLYLDGKMVNEYLLEEGMAQIATYPPNIKYADRFQEIETAARESGKGFWQEGFTRKKAEKEEEKDKKSAGLIKGNINSKGEKIYHMPHQRDYNRTKIDENKGEQWFISENEAKKAGFRKAAQ